MAAAVAEASWAPGVTGGAAVMNRWGRPDGRRDWDRPSSPCRRPRVWVAVELDRRDRCLGFSVATYTGGWRDWRRPGRGPSSFCARLRADQS